MSAWYSGFSDSGIDWLYLNTCRGQPLLGTKSSPFWPHRRVARPSACVRSALVISGSNKWTYFTSNKSMPSLKPASSTIKRQFSPWILSGRALYTSKISFLSLCLKGLSHNAVEDSTAKLLPSPPAGTLTTILFFSNLIMGLKPRAIIPAEMIFAP